MEPYVIGGLFSTTGKNGRNTREKWLGINLWNTIEYNVYYEF